VLALQRTTSATVGTLTELVAKGVTAWARNVGDNISAISEAVANGSRAVGGPPPFTRAFYTIAKATSSASRPMASASSSKPRNE
jgi:hypothetical protein